MAKVAILVCALLVSASFGLNRVSPSNDGAAVSDDLAEWPQLPKSVRRLLAVHSNEAALAVTKGLMDCSGVLLPVADMRSVEACRSAMASHQRSFYGITGDIITMLGQKRGEPEGAKVNVVNVAGEFDMGAFRLAKHVANVEKVYTVDPSASKCEWMEKIVDKNALSDKMSVVNKYVGGKDGVEFENADQLVKGSTLDQLVKDGSVPENVGFIRFTPHEHMGWTIDGIKETVEKSHPVVVTAMQLPADHHMTETKKHHINHMLQNFADWGYASFSLEESCALQSSGSSRCRNFIHVPMKDAQLQESIFHKLEAMKGVVRLDPAEWEVNKMAT